MRAVIEESQRASARRGVVYHLCHEVAQSVKEEFVAYTYLSRRLHQYVPQAHLLVKLTQQEHLNTCVGLLLRTVEARGEHLCIIEYKGVVLIKIVKDVCQRKEHLLAVLVFQRLTLGIGLIQTDFL